MWKRPFCSNLCFFRSNPKVAQSAELDSSSVCLSCLGPAKPWGALSRSQAAWRGLAGPVFCCYPLSSEIKPDLVAL